MADNPKDKPISKYMQDLYQIYTGKVKVPKGEDKDEFAEKEIERLSQQNSDIKQIFEFGYENFNQSFIEGKLVNRQLYQLLKEKSYCSPHAPNNASTQRSCNGKTTMDAAKKKLHFFIVKKISTGKPNTWLQKKKHQLAKNVLCEMMRWYEINYIPNFKYDTRLTIQSNPAQDNKFRVTGFSKVWKLKDPLSSNKSYHLVNAKKSPDFKSEIKSIEARRSDFGSAKRLQSQANLEREFYCNFEVSWVQDPNQSCASANKFPVLNNPTTFSIDQVCQDDVPCVMGALPTNILKFKFGQHIPTGKLLGPEWYPMRRGIHLQTDSLEDQFLQSVKFLLADNSIVLPSDGSFFEKARVLSRNTNTSIEIINFDKTIGDGAIPLPRGSLGRKKQATPTHYVFLYYCKGVQEFIEPIVFSKIGEKTVERKLSRDHSIVEAYLHPEQLADVPLPAKSHTESDTSVSTAQTTQTTTDQRSELGEDQDSVSPEATCKYNPYDNLETLPLVEVGSAPSARRLVLGNLYRNNMHQIVRNLYEPTIPYSLIGFCSGDPQSGIVEVSWCNDKKVMQGGCSMHSVSEKTEDSAPFFVALQKIHN
jgi:hypothetical protein